MRHVRTLVTILMSMSIGACSSLQNKHQSCMPHEPNEKTPGILYSVGTGANKLQAISDARKQLAIRLRANISFRCEDVSSTKVGNNYHECRSSMTSKLSFIDDQIEAINYCENKVQALISIDTRPLAQRLKWHPKDLLQLSLSVNTLKQRAKVPFTLFGPEESAAPIKATFKPKNQSWILLHRGQTIKISSEQLWEQLDWKVCTQTPAPIIKQNGRTTNALKAGKDTFVQFTTNSSQSYALLFSYFSNKQLYTLSPESLQSTDESIAVTITPTLQPNQRTSEEYLIALYSPEPINTYYFNNLSTNEKLKKLFELVTTPGRTICSSKLNIYPSGH